jgi:prepilin-type N-terminal cleavage/methylation domain-containing protein
LRDRRGFTLLEMLVVIAVSTIIVGIAVSLVITMMHLEKQSRKRLGSFRIQGQLAEQYRRDVRAATGLSPVKTADKEGEQAGCELQFDSERLVRYRVDGPRIVRTELAGDRPVRNESYRLLSGATAQFQLPEGESPAIAGLRIVPRDDAKRRVPVQSLRIEAVLAADHRFAQSEPQEEEEP